MTNNNPYTYLSATYKSKPKHKKKEVNSKKSFIETTKKSISAATKNPTAPKIVQSKVANITKKSISAATKNPTAPKIVQSKVANITKKLIKTNLASKKSFETPINKKDNNFFTESAKITKQTHSKLIEKNLNATSTFINKGSKYTKALEVGKEKYLEPIAQECAKVLSPIHLSSRYLAPKALNVNGKKFDTKSIGARDLGLSTPQQDIIHRIIPKKNTTTNIHKIIKTKKITQKTNLHNYDEKSKTLSSLYSKYNAEDIKTEMEQLLNQCNDVYDKKVLNAFNRYSKYQVELEKAVKHQLTQPQPGNHDYDARAHTWFYIYNRFSANDIKEMTQKLKAKKSIQPYTNKKEIAKDIKTILTKYHGLDNIYSKYNAVDIHKAMAQGLNQCNDVYDKKVLDAFNNYSKYQVELEKAVKHQLTKPQPGHRDYDARGHTWFHIYNCFSENDVKEMKQKLKAKKSIQPYTNKNEKQKQQFQKKLQDTYNKKDIIKYNDYLEKAINNDTQELAKAINKIFTEHNDLEEHDLQHDEGGHGEVLGGQVLGGVEELN